jgi:hypothetical protein
MVLITFVIMGLIDVTTHHWMKRGRGGIRLYAKEENVCYSCFADDK